MDDEVSTQGIQVADLTQADPNLTLALAVACPDGHVYTVESLDGAALGRSGPTFNAVRRLEPEGPLTLLGHDFSFDGMYASCDAATNRIIFTSGAGNWALTPP
jgi:hypothetical protein